MSRFTGEYGDEWPATSRRVRADAGDRCVRCKHPSDRPKHRARCDALCRHADDGKQRVLTVHHLDGDKSNGAWWNLLPLCQVCHLTIQGRVIVERPWLFEHSEWFKPYVAGFYASYYGGQTITREEAESNLAHWLSLAPGRGA